MKTKFFVSGSTVHVFNMNEETTLDALPPRIYTVQYSQLQGFYLTITKDQLELPEKIYGKTPGRVEKCLNTYKDRDTSTGILLTGDKGTGKTLLMSLLANKVVTDLELPVLLIKDAYAGSQFTDFIETIGECAVVFDEFGKMYASSDRHNNEGEIPQKALLSLMDGVDKTKRMFILTENSELDINDFMLNRPSRVYYHFKYKKLDEGSIVGYCQDNGVSKEIVKDITDVSRRSNIFSFDMLQSIVEEHLRFGTAIADTTEDLNIDLRESSGAMLEIVKIIERGTDTEREIFETPFVSKPGSANRYTYIKIKAVARTDQVRGRADIPELDPDDLYDEIYVQDEDLAYEKEGKLVYETDKFIFIAKNVETPRTNYWSMI